MVIIALGSVDAGARGRVLGSRATAGFTSLYLQHNQSRNGANGMYVRFNFYVTGLMGQNVKAVTTLYRSNGKKIYGYNGQPMQYTLSWRAGYPTTNFNDCWSWFNYGNMNLPRGRTDCYAVVKIYSGSGKLIHTSNRIPFWVNK